MGSFIKIVAVEQFSALRAKDLVTINHIATFVASERTHFLLFVIICFHGMLLFRISYSRTARNCQKATAEAAATFRESTPWDMGMRTT